MSHDLRTKALAIAALERGVQVQKGGAGGYISFVNEIRNGGPAQIILGAGATLFDTLAETTRVMGIEPDPALVALEAENERLRAKVQEQDAELKAVRRNGDRTNRQLMDALTHPEDYTKIRATLLAREARIGPPPWPNVRSITYQTTPSHPDFDGLNGDLRGGAFKTQDEYAKARGHNSFTITANPGLPTDTVLLVNHPMLVRAELVCARCGGWHKYMQQVIAIKDGIATDPVWVGCTEEATDSNQGEGTT